jgi:adenylate cyclase
MPAVMLYSSVIDSLLDGDAIKLPKAAYDVALFVVIAALVCLAVSFGNTVVAGVCAALLLAGAFAASYLGFAHFSRMVDPVGAMTGVVCVFAATISYREIFEGRQRRMLHNIFRHFTHPAVIKNMMQHPDKIRLGGEQKRLTILFSDVKNFSTISEQLDPEALTRLLNRYLGAMTDAVLENFGTLDKYLGDGIMAFWGAPVDNPAHANLAALAALDCVERAGRLNAELENEGIAPLTTRIGINTGEVVVGNMGSRDRFDYTVLGDAANLASRLEGVNKIFGTTILLGEATRAELPPGEFVLREIDVVRVKGRSEPARIYELVGLAEEVPDAALGRLADFAEALTLYRAGKWREAQAAFELLAAQDLPSAVYAERSAALAANPPGDDWDGVFQMTVK